MKRVVLFVVVLTLTAGLAWADEPAEAAPPTEPLFVAEEGGGCTLPDSAGLAEDESLAALLESGFEVSPTRQQVQMCPSSFSCNSITNCGKSTFCALTNIGQCCQVASGQVLCCINGPIFVERCRCRCTGNPCAIQCGNSVNVRLIC